MSDPNSKNNDTYYVITGVDTYDCSAMKFANLQDALEWYNKFDDAILTQKLDVILRAENLQGKAAIIVKGQKDDN